MKRATILISCLFGFANAAEPRAVMNDANYIFFERYCLDCHDAETTKGKVNLEDISFDLGSIPSAELWQKVLNSINSGEMPPEDKKQPKPAHKAAFLVELSQQLVVARKLLADTGGVTAMRRLNRREYQHTIRALLDVDVDLTELPLDTNSVGFDTAGNALFFSSDQLELYLKVGRQALDNAIDFGKKPKQRTSRTQPETAMNRSMKKSVTGSTAKLATFAAWQKSGRPATSIGVIDADRVSFKKEQAERVLGTANTYLSWPHTRMGVLLYSSFDGAYVHKTVLPQQTPPGNYLLRVRGGLLEGRAPEERYIEWGTTDGKRGGEMRVIGCAAIEGTVAKPATLELPIHVAKNGPRSFGIRARTPNQRDAVRRLSQKRSDKTLPEPPLWLDWVELEGPIVSQWPPASHLAIFAETDKIDLPSARVRDVIADFATKAFRGTRPWDGFLEQLFALYQDEIDRKKPKAEAIKLPLSVILASPGFLYLSEPTESKTPRPLSSRELAVRLAYFLWSAPPDAKLMKAVNAGTLKPKLQWQVNRMLDDPRADAFYRGFTHQWLHMDRLDFFQFNYRLYPDFDDSMQGAARQELYETVAALVREDRGVGELLSSQTVLVNDLLATFYDIPGVQGSEFRRVPVPEGLPRGGLLGTAAVLAMGSDGKRTSPVERGAWVMRKLLHNPPPPAPPNVPQLSRHGGKLLPARKLLEAHMAEPQCAQCHRKIDPIGFGLEHFDAVGRWREREYTEISSGRNRSKLHTIDSSGTMPDGRAFSNFFSLRERVAEQDESFARGIIEQLIEYALGRPYCFSDEQLKVDIFSQADHHNLSMRAMIHALVNSKPFQSKR
jgi:hypothetical protein